MSLGGRGANIFEKRSGTTRRFEPGRKRKYGKNPTSIIERDEDLRGIARLLERERKRSDIAQLFKREKNLSVSARLLKRGRSEQCPYAAKTERD